MNTLITPSGNRISDSKGSCLFECVQVRNPGDLMELERSMSLLNRRNRFLKRLLDIVLSVLLLLLSLPLIVIAGGLIKVWSRGPLFFSQLREGQGGVPFKVWKIRTMRHDAEKVLAWYLDTRPDLHQEWQQRYKLCRDPRIIAGIGTLLRRFSVDELPQLWNVIKGDMSLVGPRPFPEYHLRRFSPEFRKLRCLVRPGLTGLWQVNDRSAGDLREQERYDVSYIRNWSLWLDLHILGQTIFAVLGRRGTY